MLKNAWFFIGEVGISSGTGTFYMMNECRNMKCTEFRGQFTGVTPSTRNETIIRKEGNDKRLNYVHDLSTCWNLNDSWAKSKQLGDNGLSKNIKKDYLKVIK